MLLTKTEVLKALVMIIVLILSVLLLIAKMLVRINIRLSYCFFPIVLSACLQAEFVQKFLCNCLADILWNRFILNSMIIAVQ